MRGATRRTVNRMEPAAEHDIARLAASLTDLAYKHGLSGLRVAGDGVLIADVASGRTLLDVARFELEAEAVLQAVVSVISSRSEYAARAESRPLVTG